MDFDGLFPLTKYCFSSSGVNAEIIEKRIYDFDFSNPRFNILINNCDLALYDYSSFDLIDCLGVSILNDQTNIKNVNYCINSNIIATLHFEKDIDEDFKCLIGDKLLEVIKNV